MKAVEKALTNPKWKTKWCFAFQKGKCPKPADTCFYAHGREDFRSVRIAALNFAYRKLAAVQAKSKQNEL